MSLDDFLDAAWNDHAADPRGVAARLADATPGLADAPEQLGPFVQFAEHLLLGHLGDVAAMERVLAAAEPLAAARPDVQPTLQRARFAAQLLQDEQAPPGDLPPALQVRALGTAVSGQAERGDLDRAGRLLERATRIGREAGGDALKALAAACNNAASQRLDGPREPAADAWMLDTARQARGHWADAGTWMNVERADYLVARCAAAAGDAATAAVHAQACLDACLAHDADAFERFFAHEAIADARLAAADRAGAAASVETMRDLLAAIDDPASRAHAQSCLDQLAARVNPA